MFASSFQTRGSKMLLKSDEIDCSKFATTDDVAQKLSRTIVLYQGEPMYVHGIADKNTVSLMKNRDDPSIMVSIKDIDFQAPKLGLFFDSNRGTAVLPVRHTHRQYRGGLPPDCIIMKECRTVYQNTSVMYNDLVFSVLLSPDFNNMLQNKYPSVTECLNIIQRNQGVVSMPFRRYHWINKVKATVTMWFKGIPIITYDHKTRTWTEPVMPDYVNSIVRQKIQSQIQEFKDHESFV